MSKMGRKSQRQVLEEMYKILTAEPISIAEIADKVGSHHDTVKKCLELIDIIQTSPRVKIERTKLRSTTIIRASLEKHSDDKDHLRHDDSQLYSGRTDK